jgi:fumarate hydratase class II
MPREMNPVLCHSQKSLCNCQSAKKSSRVRREKTLSVKSAMKFLAGQHADNFPLYVWMTGSGTQFNMNINEVISNRCSQLTGNPLGSKTPVDPN